MDMKKVKADDDNVFEWGSCNQRQPSGSLVIALGAKILTLEGDIRTYLPEGFLKISAMTNLSPC